jgi:dTDP-4-amino-4,6-dideoxygalactose transaminase
MDPGALEKAFELYPETRLVVIAHLYGTPGKAEELRAVCDEHGALIVEDAAESFGAECLLNGEWVETGAIGDFNCISFNGNNKVSARLRLIGRGQGAELRHGCNEIAA